MTTTEILSLLRDARRQGGGWQAKCPAHKDDIASLSVSTGDDGRTLLKCHAGCTAAAICRALGIKMADLFVQKSKKAKGEARIIATYDYKRNGELIFQVVRMEPKDFRLRRPDGRGGWIWKMNGTPLSLYHYDEIVNAPEGETIFVVEGEKDADRLRGLGVFATTNALGAGKWRDYYSATLRGNRVAILVDNDDTGRNHGRQVANSVWGIAAEVKIIELPGLPPKGDVSDWLDTGGDKSKLVEIVNATKPLTAEDIEAMQQPQPAETGKGILAYPFTDAGAAELFAAEYGERFVFNHDAGKWLIYDGRRWNMKTGDIEVRKAVVKLARTIREEALKPENTDRREGIERYARSLEASSKISNVLREAEAYLAKYADDFDTARDLLNVVNGTVNLRTGELQPHNPNDFITKLAPVVYDRTAKHVMLDKFLVDSTGGDEEMIAFLQRSAGYTLSGFTDEEKFFLVHGPEASGKSTFLEMLKAVLGDYAQTADFETFVARNQVGGARNDIARLAGARFVPSIEVDEGRRLAEGLVKTITGGDSICARFLYREAFEFRPQFKLWLACNHAPRISEGDGGMWRRILRVPFEHTVPESERDPKVKATLKNVDEAGPAILAWAVEGCLRWQMEGLNVPDGVTAATAQYRQEQDPLAEFLDDMCNVGDEDLFVPVTDLRKSYERWASDVGVKHTLGAKAFNERLESRGCRRVTRRYYNDLGTAKIGKCWVGITLVCNRFPSTLSDENDDSLPI